ncbi:hypothetical protein K493DRAFT_337753 [Basidiobolus meristosporus CBS 931.73]|uniref:Gem-associated protein 2 n=1 Tax=Basidiobolus meristosporus CBS 931.73 TaxID=1314790 RepID=A0A1Y1Y9V0_9FUNG|nr:hypothetical protein K493DRAFT_340656 [Basidiobolus meristosporus CBS 931.73]ORX94526.1 hypothetical protein K493DRAFT_337753 [Basidiobolus meristosporus CBS 931.73]|eukprot:ORX89428.1 hypothetical protein K493DRAFT_340656 [Basidiobolus meristosporus CBS 931.73]
MATNSKTKLYVKGNDEEDWNHRSALPVATADVDLDGPPTTGEEYLRMVRMEANNRPSVFIAKNKPSTSIPTSIPKTPREAEKVKGQPVSRVPSPEWREAFKLRFSRLRKTVEERRKTIKSSSRIEGLPGIKDETAWLGLLYGDSSKAETPAEAQPLLPYASVVLKMDQKTTLALLEYHIDWLDEDSLTKNQVSIASKSAKEWIKANIHAKAQWLFALLLRVDKLLTSDSISTLRELCRQWGAIRTNLARPLAKTIPSQTNGTGEQIASLNMLISIVIDYFGQLDLWEEINSDG